MSSALASMNCRAGGTINITRFVKCDTASDNCAIQAIDGTVLPLGVSTDQSKTRPDSDIVANPNVIAALIGDQIKIFVEGAKGISLYCNAAWTRGDLLMPDANGYGIVCTPGNYYGARAQTNGTVGSLCTVDVITGLLSERGSISATTQTIISNGTILLSGDGLYERVTEAGNVTGIILTPGTSDGQQVVVLNTAAQTITFAASGTSNVSGGTAVVIANSQAQTFVWSATDSLWFPI